jgi:predicted  nucleic acid-binding Zn-ribbon protein
MDLPAEREAGEWECMECGYIEAGVKGRRLKACPECGAPAQAMEFFAYGDDEDAWEDEAARDLYDEEDEDETEDDDIGVRRV